MDSPIAAVRRLIAELLTRVGKAHPQALVYPLTLASKSQVQSRKTMALSMMDQMLHSQALNSSWKLSNNDNYSGALVLHLPIRAVS